MHALLSPPILYIAFAVTAMIELYFFMMQRSSLEISRAADINPRDGRFMLPLWYLWSWLVRFVKWTAAIAIAVTIHWGVALVLLAIPFVISGVVPIPHRHYMALFRSKVRTDLARGENPELFQMLDENLDRAEYKLAAK